MERGFFKEHAITLAAQGLHFDVLPGKNTGLRGNCPLRCTTCQPVKVLRQDNIREYIRSYPVFPFSEKLNYQSWVRTMLSFYDHYTRECGHPDIIQVHSSLWAGVMASQIPKRYRVPYAITEHRSRFVLPCRFEAFGVPLIEAMATGLPVIAGRSGGPESFLIPETGMMVEPDQPETLAKAILKMRLNHHQYSPSFIRNYVVENFAHKK